MPKEVELPDGSVAEFPDDMDDAAIEAVLKKEFAAPAGNAPSAPAPRTISPAPTPGGGGDEPVTLGGVLSEVPGVLKDYGIGALKGVGRIGTGLAMMEAARTDPRQAIDMKRRKAELDKRFGLVPEEGVQEAGGAIPYMVGAPQGIMANAALAGGGALLETMDPSEAAGAAVAGGVAGGLVPAAKKLGGRFMAAAVEQYRKALHPTTRAAKVETEKIVPELLKRRMSGDLESLGEMGAQKSEDLGQTIAGRYAKSSRAIDASQIADDLERLKAPFIERAGSGGVAPGGQPVAPGSDVVMDPAALNAIESIQDKLREFGTARPESLWKYRQVLDRVVRASKGFTQELSPESAGEISRQARQALQAELTRSAPDIGSLNAEYKLWEALQDIARETSLRKVGQQGAGGMLARGAGMVAGSSIGGATGGPMGAAVGAVTGQQVAKKVAEIMSSPRWRTVSAVNKARVSDLLNSGATEEALTLAQRLIVGSAASSSAEDLTTVRRKVALAQQMR